MAKVVVTGGAGFIGSHIVDAFLADSHEVCVIDDLSSGDKNNLSTDARLIEQDICSEETRQFLADYRPDILIHAAAQISVRLSMEDPVYDSRVNVSGIANILHSFGTESFPFFVFISTGGAIYGEQEAFPANEEHPIAPTSLYGLNKHVGEQYLAFWAREMGLSFAALRLGNIYGPRQNPHGEAGVVAIFNKLLLAGKTATIFGSGDQTRDFVYVGDVVRAVKAVSDKRVSGVFNIGTGQETSVNELYKEICVALDVDRNADYQPGKVGEQMRSVIDSSLAQKTFDWTPEVSLSEGIKRTSDWFSQK